MRFRRVPCAGARTRDLESRRAGSAAGGHLPWWAEPGRGVRRGRVGGGGFGRVPSDASSPDWHQSGHRNSHDAPRAGTSPGRNVRNPHAAAGDFVDLHRGCGARGASPVIDGSRHSRPSTPRRLTTRWPPQVPRRRASGLMRPPRPKGACDRRAREGAAAGRNPPVVAGRRLGRWISRRERATPSTPPPLISAGPDF